MGSTTMPMSVLERVKGNKISDAIKKAEGFNPNETYRVTFIPDKEIRREPPKRKVYSDEVKAIVAEGKRLHEEDLKAGKTREESFKEFFEAQKEIEKYL